MKASTPGHSFYLSWKIPGSMQKHSACHLPKMRWPSVRIISENSAGKKLPPGLGNRTTSTDYAVFICAKTTGRTSQQGEDSICLDCCIDGHRSGHHTVPDVGAGWTSAYFEHERAVFYPCPALDLAGHAGAFPPCLYPARGHGSEYAGVSCWAVCCLCSVLLIWKPFLTVS